MEHENDLSYHALNYRGARTEDAELFWKELQACVDRLIAAEREACAKLAEAHYIFGHSVAGPHFAALLAEKIRMRSN